MNVKEKTRTRPKTEQNEEEKKKSMHIERNYILKIRNRARRPNEAKQFNSHKTHATTTTTKTKTKTTTSTTTHAHSTTHTTYRIRYESTRMRLKNGEVKIGKRN